MTTGALSNLRKARQLQRTVKAFTTMEKIRFSLNSHKQKSRLSYCAPCGQNTPRSINMHLPINLSTPILSSSLICGFIHYQIIRFSSRAIVLPQIRTVIWNINCWAKTRYQHSLEYEIVLFLYENHVGILILSQYAETPLNCAICQL